MIDLCNISEKWVREARYLLIYEASALSFNQNFKGIKPVAGTHLLKISLSPHHFSRQVSLKTKDKNDYFDIKIQFSLLDLTHENRTLLYSFHRKRNFVAVLVSNAEMLVLGNDRERLSIAVDDNIQDNTSGKDTFEITLTGQTIIFPSINKITESFRVLLFVPPLE